MVKLFLVSQYTVPDTACACLPPILHSRDVLPIRYTHTSLLYVGTPAPPLQRSPGTGKWRWTQVAFARPARYWLTANVSEPVHREHSEPTESSQDSHCEWLHLSFPPCSSSAHRWGSESPQVQSGTTASQNAAKKGHFYLTLLFRDTPL